MLKAPALLRRLSTPARVALGVAAAIVTLFFVDAEFWNHVQAATDAFAKAEEKGNDLSEMLKGKIAVIVTTIVLIVVGLMMQFNRIPHTIGIRILIGTLVIGSAAGIAEWAYA